MMGARPDPHRASRAFERAMTAAREQNAKLLELQAATRLAELHNKIGEPSTGLERIEELCDWFGPASRLRDVVRARAVLISATMA
jgi:hypothetical protein